MPKKHNIPCKGCIHYQYCQIQPEPGCFESKKDVSMEEKIARRKELAAFRRRAAKMYNR